MCIGSAFDESLLRLLKMKDVPTTQEAGDNYPEEMFVRYICEIKLFHIVFAAYKCYNKAVSLT